MSLSNSLLSTIYFSYLMTISSKTLLMFFSFLSDLSGECSDSAGFSFALVFDLTGLFVLKKLKTSGNSSISTVLKRVL